MAKLAHSDVLYFLIQLSLMLIFSRLFGSIFRSLKQPAVVGEIFGGILLGPSVFAKISPEYFHELFFSHPNASIAMDGIFSISLIMLLFISGMEVELPLIWRNGKSALLISFTGMLIPLGIGFGAGWYLYSYFGMTDPDYRLAFSLFLGTALSITALPVIAKILLDLNLLNSKIGSLIITCAMMNDFVGWILFSVVLGMLPGTGENIANSSIVLTVILTLAFAIFVLTVVKFIFNKILYYIGKKITGPGGTLSIAMAMCFIGAVSTEAIGVHAVFGAFLMGMAFGESMQFSEGSKNIIYQFVANIFAPLFFVSIGLKVDFIQSFELGAVLIILAIAFISKILGGYLGGRLGGLSSHESWAIGFGINARGAMEIILGLIALQFGLISENIFVALTIMAIITSVTSGNFIKFFLNKEKLKSLQH